MTMRPAPRSPGVSVVLNEAKRGPRSIASEAGPSPGLTFATRSGDVVAGKRRIERVGFEADDRGAALLRDRVRRRRRDIECQPRRPSRAVPCARRRAGRGCRRRGSSRDGLRSSTREPRAGTERARHEVDRHVPRRVRREPARLGSEISRPLTRGQALPGDSTIVCVPAVTVSPPAAASSRHDDVEQPREIVEREHLLAGHHPRRKRPSSFARQHGIGRGAGWRLRGGRGAAAPRRAAPLTIERTRRGARRS